MNKISRKELLPMVFSRRMLVTLLMGFASGLPLILIGSTLQAWMVDAKVDLTVIGIFALVALPYTCKFLWAPTMDRFTPPFLGRRRGWMLITQFALAISLVGMAMTDPGTQTWQMAFLALCVSFSSASQDILIDAYRREALNERELAFGSALYVLGYRVAMAVASALPLILSARMEWKTIYLVMAGLVGVGVLTTLWAPEPKAAAGTPKTLKEAVVAPFLEFFKRTSWQDAVLVLSFILLFKVGDAMATTMTMPYYLELGYTRPEVGWVVKGFGLFATIGGTLLGGMLVYRWGTMRSLWIFGILQGAAVALFPLLQFVTIPERAPVDPASAQSVVNLINWTQPHILALAALIASENVSMGLGTSAYLGFMASLTNKRYTATQYALLTSLMAFPRVVLSAPTGWMAKTFGWTPFFLICTAIAIPGLLLIAKIRSEPVSPVTE